MELTINQIDGLKMVLRNLDSRVPIELTFRDRHVIVDSPKTKQHWDIGPGWRRG